VAMGQDMPNSWVSHPYPWKCYSPN